MPSGLIAPEIPAIQNPAAPFLSAFVATSQINNKRRQLENQLQQMELRNQQMQTKSQMDDLKYGLAVQGEQRKRERADDLYTLGQQGIAVREGALKLASDKASADMQDKQEKLRRDALGLFTKQRLTYRGPRGTPLPADAFENPESWQTDPNKPGKRFYNAPVFNPQTGQPIADPNNPKKTLVDPITIDNDTYGHLKGMYDATKKDMPTSRQVAPDPPVVEAPAFPADPSQAVSGQSYTTPKGVLTWTGTGFRTP